MHVVVTIGPAGLTTDNSSTGEVLCCAIARVPCSCTYLWAWVRAVPGLLGSAAPMAPWDGCRLREAAAAGICNNQKGVMTLITFVAGSSSSRSAFGVCNACIGLIGSANQKHCSTPASPAPVLPADNSICIPIVSVLLGRDTSVHQHGQHLFCQANGSDTTSLTSVV